MNSRLDRYVARTWISSCFVAVVFFIGLVGVYDFFAKLDDLVGHDYEGSLVALLGRFYMYSLPIILLRVEPFVMLVAALSTIARLQRHNEFMAMLMTGRSSLRVIWPIFLLTGVFVVSMVWVQEVLGPKLSQARIELESRLFHHGELIVDEIDIKDADGRDIRARNFRVEEGVIGILYVSYKDSRGRHVSVEGHDAFYDEASGGWRLRDGTTEIREADQQAVVEEAAFVATDIGPEDMLLELLGEFGLSYGQVIERGERYPLSTRYRLLRHYHVTYPLSVMLLVLLGVPFVIRRRVGSRWVGMGIAFLICTGYMVMDTSLRELGKQDMLLPVVAVWLPVIVAGSLAVVLLDTVDS